MAGKAVYSAKHRAAFEAHLPASSQTAARLLFAQYDALCDVRDQAHKDLVATAARQIPSYPNRSLAK